MIYKQLPERTNYHGEFYFPTSRSNFGFIYLVKSDALNFSPRHYSCAPSKRAYGGDVLIEFANFAFAPGEDAAENYPRL